MFEKSCRHLRVEFALEEAKEFEKRLLELTTEAGKRFFEKKYKLYAVKNSFEEAKEFEESLLELKTEAGKKLFEKKCTNHCTMNADIKAISKKTQAFEKYFSKLKTKEEEQLFKQTYDGNFNISDVKKIYDIVKEKIEAFKKDFSQLKTKEGKILFKKTFEKEFWCSIDDSTGDDWFKGYCEVAKEFEKSLLKIEIPQTREWFTKQFSNLISYKDRGKQAFGRALNHKFLLTKYLPNFETEINKLSMNDYSDKIAKFTTQALIDEDSA